MTPVLWQTFFTAGALALMTAVASAGPEQAPKPKAKAPPQRLAEIDRELEQNREKIATAIKAVKSLPCGNGVLDVIAQVRNDRQKLEELRKKGVPAGDLAASTERVRQGDEMLEKLRVHSAMLNVESLNEDVATLKQRIADLEAERAALVKAAPGAR
jgi:hypothetical protein